jgi:hypothetical protein
MPQQVNKVHCSALAWSMPPTRYKLGKHPFKNGRYGDVLAGWQLANNGLIE